MPLRSDFMKRVMVIACLAIAATAASQERPSAGTGAGEEPDRSLPELPRPALEKALPPPEALAIPEPPAGTWGVVASGTGGGAVFRDADSEAEAWLGADGVGVWGLGSSGGGYFEGGSGLGSSVALVGTSEGAGIWAVGADCGGLLRDWDWRGYAYVGCGDSGIGVSSAGSAAGGYFAATNGTGWALAGYGDEGEGIRAGGSASGGYFQDSSSDETGEAWLGIGDIGIKAKGSEAGAFFYDPGFDNYAWAAYSSYKILGNGTCSFVQNHPDDPSLVVVYAAPEGDEVATYTRGSARLRNGEARVPLGDTFRWVTNPDIGLTAHLSARGEPVPLAVVSVSTDELVVRAPPDAPRGLVFDYLVYGLRIGFEQSTVVQEKRQEAWIPSMRHHRELLARRPELGRYTALSRFAEQREALGVTDELDTSRAQALVAAIHEFDPAVDRAERPEQGSFEAGPGGDGSDGGAGRKQTAEAEEDVSLAQPHRDGQRLPERPKPAATVPEDDEGNVYATSFRPSSAELASVVMVSETVEPGDVLVIDRSSAGMLRRSFEGHDTGVAGVATANASVVLGSQPPALGAGGSVATPLRAELAMVGVVRCKVDAAYGAIRPGDLLVSSPNPGHAMRVDTPLPGTIVGKALEPLAEGTGRIRVLVMLR